MAEEPEKQDNENVSAWWLLKTLAPGILMAFAFLVALQTCAALIGGAE